ncbi:AMP-binding protein [Pseudomonas sp. BGr12]|uniref:AMP-binding protein n=1 Tax=unclassified Pseudomonas TaxID=196821 RepID=UPI0017873E84|nr:MULTISPECIES: AMP-binding protein [unclassified Pseudomonas]MBD9501557.1 acyl-CoA synthetase [Pseudomonas sp. PDM17]MDL2427175.1 AMP-binding protein [Pseudomonas sp. BJa5]
MKSISLARLLLELPAGRPLALEPTLLASDFLQRVCAAAGALRQRNARRVAIHLEDAAELAIALYAAWLAGAEAVLPADNLAHSRERLASRIDAWIGDQPGDLLLAELNGPALPPAPLAPEELDLDACRLVLSTSGSTGEPKLISKSLRQLSNEVQVLEALWGEQLGDARILGSVAAQHIYGLLFRVLWPLSAGRAFLRRQIAFPEDLQRLSLDQPRFAWVGSPALLKRMGDNLDWPALRPVVRVFSSGGPLPAEAGEQLHERLGQAPTEIYGSSETGGIAWRQGGQLWQPFEGVMLNQDEHGALRIESTYLPPGETEQTADAARICADGRFELLGRLDRIVKLEEKRISLPQLEAALMKHPFVSEARLGVVQENRASLGALVALSDAGLYELRNGGRRALTQRLREHLADHCEALALPRRWRLLRRLPGNAQGKLPQSLVDELLHAPRSRDPDVLTHNAVDGEQHFQLEIPLDLAYFPGHFPKAPVLPGVVQVQWAQQLGRQVFDLPPRFGGMEVLKFQQLLRPGDLCQLALRWDAERGKLYFAFTRGEAACSSGRILLGADE